MFGRKKKAEPAVSADTNLPELPDHYFWKVGEKEGYGGGGWGDGGYKGYGISIRSDFQRKPIYRSDLIEGWRCGDVEASIKSAAHALKVKFDFNRKFIADQAKFAGEYPPKRMP